MRFRTQVWALAGLLVLLPLGGLVSLLLSHQVHHAPDIPLFKLVILEQWVQTHLKINQELQIQVKPHSKTSLFELAIFNRQGDLVYSTLPTGVYRPGNTLASGEQALDSLPPDREAALLPLTKDGAIAGQILVVFRDLDSQPAPLLELTSDLAFQVLLIVLFSSLAITLWLRRFTKNLQALGRYTSKLEVTLTAPLPWQTLKTDELRGLAHSIENLRRVLNEEGLQRYRFLSALTHDLKTPLTSVKGYVELLKDGLGTAEERTQWFSILEEKTNLLETRLQSLFQFARMETKPWALTRQKADLSAFLNHLAEIFATDAKTWKRTWVWQNELPPLLCSFDPVMTTRALENLVQNAFRYSGLHGIVHFKAWYHEGQVYLEVQNNGPSIPLEDRPVLFEPFTRGKLGGEGLGLGLYITKAILHAQGWEVFLKETDPTTFVIKFDNEKDL